MSVLFPALKRGVTLACFRSSGKTPVDRDLLISIASGLAIRSAVSTFDDVYGKIINVLSLL